jgi:hypothetical protein
MPSATRSARTTFDDGFTMLIGPAPNADLLELGMVSGTDGPVIVHAMQARQRFLE